MIDTFIDGSVDKIDNKILKEQIDFFSEIRHAYHEFNMVEEAIYQVSQDDEKDISRQGEKIYEILISDDPEMELEKYYDISWNVSISVSTICAKGQVIGIDKEGVGRVITETCDSTYTIPASSLGVGKYSAYFSVYNGSGTKDTKRVEFEIVDMDGARIDKVLVRKLEEE